MPKMNSESQRDLDYDDLKTDIEKTLKEAESAMGRREVASAVEAVLRARGYQARVMG